MINICRDLYTQVSELIRKLADIVVRHDNPGGVNFSICDPIMKRFQANPEQQINHIQGLFHIQQFDGHYLNTVSIINEIGPRIQEEVISEGRRYRFLGKIKTCENKETLEVLNSIIKHQQNMVHGALSRKIGGLYRRLYGDFVSKIEKQIEKKTIFQKVQELNKIQNRDL